MYPTDIGCASLSLYLAVCLSTYPSIHLSICHFLSAYVIVAKLMYACMHGCMYGCMQACVDVCKFACVCRHECMNARMNVCTRTLSRILDPFPKFRRETGTPESRSTEKRVRTHLLIRHAEPFSLWTCTWRSKNLPIVSIVVPFVGSTKYIIRIL